MRALLVLAVLCPVSPLLGQEPPQGPPPPTSNTVELGPGVHELLPDVGKIGAQVGFAGGAAWSPYKAGTGYVAGGFIDLPLTRAPGGKLSYEILLSLGSAQSEPFFATSAVAVVANLAAGASLQDALAGPPAAPFPVRREVTSRVRVLEVSPFALKWTITKLDEARLRPYVAAGFDFMVVITREDPLRDESLVFPGTAPFDDPLIAGLIAQAPELTARGYPTGQGNMEFGFHANAGIEFRLSKTLSLNADYRYAVIGDTPNNKLQTATGALGFHW
jgi:opacity protein-like surface antigen